MRRLQQILGRKHQRNLHVCSYFYFPNALLLHICGLCSDLCLIYAGNICPSPDFWTKSGSICAPDACRQCGMLEITFY